MRMALDRWWEIRSETCKMNLHYSTNARVRFGLQGFVIQWASAHKTPKDKIMVSTVLRSQVAFIERIMLVGRNKINKSAVRVKTVLKLTVTTPKHFSPRSASSHKAGDTGKHRAIVTTT